MHYCRAKGIEPGIAKLHALVNCGSVSHFLPNITAQMYLYFIDSEDPIPIAPANYEYSDYEWVSPQEAFAMFEQGGFRILDP